MVELPHLERVVGHALGEAVEEGVVLEELEPAVVVQVALPRVVAELVRVAVGVDHLGSHRVEELHAGVEAVAVLQNFGLGHGHVQEYLSKYYVLVRRQWMAFLPPLDNLL